MANELKQQDRRGRPEGPEAFGRGRKPPDNPLAQIEPRRGDRMDMSWRDESARLSPLRGSFPIELRTGGLRPRPNAIAPSGLAELPCPLRDMVKHGVHSSAWLPFPATGYRPLATENQNAQILISLF